ncbi:hypothetical protein [Lysinibacillus sphaericus]|uniref:hypothetical protein n=1 Tax=Lysinibacillus sphaericus TaxID=1421 RepID=UPI0018CDD49A|nr:hypothetical protein [Lysinibacillus sphaericus]
MTFKDKNGETILVNTQVQYEGDIYNVEQNPFSNQLVIDNECGQVDLSKVHFKCEIIKL